MRFHECWKTRSIFLKYYVAESWEEFGQMTN